MFKDFVKDLENRKANISKIFEKSTKQGAVQFVNYAKDLTDREGLVDTGNYKRNWQSEVTSLDNGEHSIVCTNEADYASHLEYGHKTRNGGRAKGHFVGTVAFKQMREGIIKEIDTGMKKLFDKI